MRFRVGDGDAHDVASEVFARAWANRATCDPSSGDAAAWLWTIARNAATDWHRRQKTAATAAPVHAHEATVAAPIGDPAETTIHAMDLAQAVNAMRLLSDRDREIIALRFGAGHTNRAIARSLGMTENNVGVRLHRALMRMREDLQRGARR